MGRKFRKVDTSGNDKDNVKKQIKKLIFYSITGLILLLSCSYAVVTLTLNGKDNFTMRVGNFSISFVDSDIISMEDIYPVTDSEGMGTDSYNFSIENTGDVDGIYRVYLEEFSIDNDTLSKSNVKYSIKKGSNKWSKPQILPDDLVLIENDKIDATDIINCKLKLWLDEDASNDAQNKIFKARIVVDAVQAKLDDESTSGA